MRAALQALALVGLFLAGCAQPVPPTDRGDESSGLHFGPPRPAFESFGRTEPTVAALPDGTLLVTSNCANALAMGSVERPFSERREVPPPAGAHPTQGRCDDLVQVDGQGRVFFSALVATPSLPTGGGNIFLMGIQVARSDDGARTWASNIYLSPATEPRVLGADRQWLTFGGGDTVFLTYWHFAPPTGLWVARSDDAGQSFDAFVRVVPTEDRQYLGLTGPVQVDSDGRLLLPYFASNGEPPSGTAPDLRVRIAVSEDGGATWAHRDVVPEAGRSPDAFTWPVAAVDAEGTWHIVWTNAEGAVLHVASTDDGSSWSSPRRWNPEGQVAWLPPAVAARDGLLNVAWFAQEEDGQSLWVAREQPSGFQAAEVAHLNTTAATTDFAWLATLPDGRIALPWGDPELGVVVAVET